MKISIQETDELTMDEIVIRCRMVTDEILQIVHKMKNPQNTITGMDGKNYIN